MIRHRLPNPQETPHVIGKTFNPVLNNKIFNQGQNHCTFKRLSAPRTVILLHHILAVEERYVQYWCTYSSAACSAAATADPSKTFCESKIQLFLVRHHYQVECMACLQPPHHSLGCILTSRITSRIRSCCDRSISPAVIPTSSATWR